MARWRNDLGLYSNFKQVLDCLINQKLRLCGNVASSADDLVSTEMYITTDKLFVLFHGIQAAMFVIVPVVVMYMLANFVPGILCNGKWEWVTEYPTHSEQTALSNIYPVFVKQLNIYQIVSIKASYQRLVDINPWCKTVGTKDSSVLCSAFNEFWTWFVLHCVVMDLFVHIKNLNRPV